jgi:predicted HicB family RNase H-like nuclease
MSRSGNTIQINISIPKGLHAKVKEAAKADNRSVSNFVAGVISKSINQEEEK